MTYLIECDVREFSIFFLYSASIGHNWDEKNSEGKHAEDGAESFRAV